MISGTTPSWQNEPIEIDYWSFYYQTSQSTWLLSILIGWKQIISWESKITFLHYFHKNLCNIMRAAFKKAAFKKAALKMSLYLQFFHKKEKGWKGHCPMMGSLVSQMLVKWQTCTDRWKYRKWHIFKPNVHRHKWTKKEYYNLTFPILDNLEHIIHKLESIEIWLGIGIQRRTSESYSTDEASKTNPKE